MNDALETAAERGMAGIVEDLLSRADFDRDQISRAIQAAVVNGYQETVEVLFKYVNPDDELSTSSTRVGVLALFNAITHNRFGIITYLVEQGVKINEPDGHGLTALNTALRSEIEDAHFLEEGTDIPTIPDSRLTELLIKLGADVHADDSKGITPLFIARHNHPVAERLLREHGAIR